MGVVGRKECVRVSEEGGSVGEREEGMSERATMECVSGRSV